MNGIQQPFLNLIQYGQSKIYQQLNQQGVKFSGDDTGKKSDDPFAELEKLIDKKKNEALGKVRDEKEKKEAEVVANQLLADNARAQRIAPIINQLLASTILEVPIDAKGNLYKMSGWEVLTRLIDSKANYFSKDLQNIEPFENTDYKNVFRVSQLNVEKLRAFTKKLMDFEVLTVKTKNNYDGGGDYSTNYNVPNSKDYDIKKMGDWGIDLFKKKFTLNPTVINKVSGSFRWDDRDYYNAVLSHKDRRRLFAQYGDSFDKFQQLKNKYGEDLNTFRKNQGKIKYFNEQLANIETIEKSLNQSKSSNFLTDIKDFLNQTVFSVTVDGKTFNFDGWQTLKRIVDHHGFIKLPQLSYSEDRKINEQVMEFKKKCLNYDHKEMINILNSKNLGVNYYDYSLNEFYGWKLDLENKTILEVRNLKAVKQEYIDSLQTLMLENKKLKEKWQPLQDGYLAKIYGNTEEK